MSRARRVLAIPPTAAPRCFPAHARFAPRHPLAMKTDVLPRRKPIWRSPLSRLRERLFSEAFLTSLAFLTTHPYRALKGAASGANDRAGSVAIGTAAAIVRANLPGPARHDAGPFRFTRIPRMLITPAFAQAAGGGDTNSMLMSLLPFALIFVIMYFLILRPQQKKVKDHAELVKNIRRGDTVVTSGGLVGKVTKVVDEDQIEFEISDGVRVRQMRQMISGVRAKGEPAKEKAETSKDETSAS